MKKCYFLIVLMITSFLSHSQNSSDINEEKLLINTSNSELKWIGEYAFYFGGHDGVISFKQGYLLKRNGAISGGEFIIDMHSIQSLDMDNKEARKDLDNHLKNEDFFDVEKFPTAKLVITSVAYDDNRHVRVTADLTIKDVTLPINFHADLDYQKEQLKTRFKIDRTLWGVTYNSKEVEGKLKDGLISDAIGFEVLISLK